MRHEKYWALRDVSFDLRAGETLGVIGKNGVGKSSLLRLLSGIVAPDTGHVICAYGITTSLLTLQVGFNPSLSGRDNIFLSSLIRGIDPNKISTCMPDTLSLADLGEFIDQPVRTYSTGMKARLGFAISLQMDPDVLLLDEVLGVGDAEFREKSTAIMRERIRGEHSVVIVSHNISTIRELCDRVLWIENGVVKMFDVTDTVLESYNPKQVRRDW